MFCKSFLIEYTVYLSLIIILDLLLGEATIQIEIGVVVVVGFHLWGKKTK